MDINTTRLRCLLGWLAILLPWVSAAFTCMWPPSISETWYSNAGPAFIIILGSASLLLISYKGYERIDDILTTITGILGLCICLFPCWPNRTVNNYTGPISTPFLVSHDISNIVHNCCAIAFFALLAINSLFLFTKHTPVMTKRKKVRNIIYIICGVGMLASFLLMLLPYFYTKLWIVETIALFFFGISWLTKANYYPWLVADKKIK